MLDLSPLDRATRLLMTVPLKPVQGDRFQPTGFPSLGAADYQKPTGKRTVLVESAQSMANRFEAACWDITANKPAAELTGISHVSVHQGNELLTDSMLEAHRLNSVYIEKSREEFLGKTLAPEMGVDKAKPVNRKKFIEALVKYDVGCLIHGVFLESLDGRLRIARALSSFIEAVDVEIAASGGVKNDRVKATKEEGKTSKEGFGNIPFARDEYVAERINLYINLDLTQIRGYGIGNKVERLLMLLALYKICKLIDGDLRLRTACDLVVDRDAKISIAPKEFTLPFLEDLIGKDSKEGELQKAIKVCKDLMVHTTVNFEDDLKKAKDEKKSKAEADDAGEDDDNEVDNE
ncbi:MAG TPA: type I-U CRISPR-associated RAMP protein Csb1/Cas7u [Gemmataceae bacterium]|nr:type I-U CRISPR-associated RAMP protein Csb1/Cas7u [Gemmataceae bacterium]